MPAPVVFLRPSPAWFLLLDGGLLLLALLATDEDRYEATADVLVLPPRSRLKALLAGAVALHAGEALYARQLARRHGLPSGRWARQTLLVGFPSLLALRKVAASNGAAPRLDAG